MLIWYEKFRRTSHHSSCYRRVKKSILTSCDKFFPFDWNKEGTFSLRTWEKLWKQQLIDVHKNSRFYRRKKHVKGACLIGDHRTISLCYRHQLSRFYGHVFLSAHQTFIYRFLTSLVKGGGGETPLWIWRGRLKPPKRSVSGSPLRRRNLNGQLRAIVIFIVKKN